MDDIDFDELDRAVNSLVSGTSRTITPDEGSDDFLSTSVVEENVIKKQAEAVTDVDEAKSVRTDEVIAKSVIETATKETPKVVEKKTPVLVSVPYRQRERPLVTTAIAPPKPMPVTTFESLARKRSVGKFVDVINGLGSNSKKIGDAIIESDEVATPVNPTEGRIEQTPQIAAIVDDKKLEELKSAPVTQLDKDIDEISDLITKVLNPNKSKDVVDAPDLVKTTDNFGNSIVEIGGSQSNANKYDLLKDQLPPELGNELLSIESDDYEVEKKPQDINKRIAIAPVSINDYENGNINAINDNLSGQIAPIEKINEEIVNSEPQNKVVSIAPVSLDHPASELMARGVSSLPPAYTSINQQYPEAPAIRNNDIVPIYDENNYHDIDDLGAKKGFLTWIAWIFSLVIIGAGVGMVAFFFILPNMQ